MEKLCSEWWRHARRECYYSSCTYSYISCISNGFYFGIMGYLYGNGKNYTVYTWFIWSLKVYSLDALGGNPMEQGNHLFSCETKTMIKSCVYVYVCVFFFHVGDIRGPLNYLKFMWCEEEVHPTRNLGWRSNLSLSLSLFVIWKPVVNFCEESGELGFLFSQNLTIFWFVLGQNLCQQQMRQEREKKKGKIKKVEQVFLSSYPCLTLCGNWCHSLTLGRV